MIITYGSVRVPATARDEVEAKASELQSATLAEPGCIDYGFSWSIGADATLSLIERWQDEDAVHAHKASDHAKAFTAWIGGIASAAPDFVSFETAAPRQP